MKTITNTTETIWQGWDHGSDPARFVRLPAGDSAEVSDELAADLGKRDGFRLAKGGATKPSGGTPSGSGDADASDDRPRRGSRRGRKQD